MERPSTPPTVNPSNGKQASPTTPEVTRRIEENRLKAKTLRERSLAAQAASASDTHPSKTPSGFLATTPSTLKRTHSSLATTVSVPSTSRDARQSPSKAPSTDDASIVPARKFRKYVDHDFSKMTDTKGGFLAAEDDPWNKALFSEGDKEVEKPKHMTLKEWERYQLLKGLRRRKEGPFEPGLSVLDGDGEVKGKDRKKCKECGSREIDWVWEETFGCCVCGGCKDRFPERYSLLTKTECKDDYLLTDPELRDEDLLPHLNKPNPHKSHWHDMMLFLRYQVEEFAFKKWGSSEALDEEYERREVDKRKRKEEKFKTKLNELKKRTRTDAYRRGMRGEGKGGKFGDIIGKDKHEHEWGQTVENEEGVTVKSCIECGMEVEELEF